MANCVDVNNELLSKYRSSTAEHVNNCSDPSRLVQMIYLQREGYEETVAAAKYPEMTEKNSYESRWCENGVDDTHLKAEEEDDAHKKRVVSLPSTIEKEEIMEEMLDWEWYMRCKEQYGAQPPPSNDHHHQMLPPIRNSFATSNLIRIHFTKAERFALSNTYCDSKDNNDSEEPEHVQNAETEEQKKKRCETADLEKAKGNQFYNSCQYEEAIEHYSEALRLYEIINLSLSNRAEACSEEKAYIRSKLSNVEKITEENRSFKARTETHYSQKIIALLNNRAMSNIKLENFGEALADLNEVLKTNPRNVKARFRRAKCWRQFRMYEQAIKDIAIVLEIEPTLQEAKTLRNQIKQDKSISGGGGKLYRVRENFDQKDTFSVEEGRLTVYANCKDEYLLEVDKTGCVKHCICGFCTLEDRRTMNKSTGLRIKERDRWKLLTQNLLDEMKICASKHVQENAAATPYEL